jgi:hypothetical protein
MTEKLGLEEVETEYFPFNPSYVYKECRSYLERKKYGKV